MGSGLARLRSFPPDSLRGFLQGTAVRLRDVTMGGAPSVFSVSRLMAPWGLYELPKLAIPMPEDGDPPSQSHPGTTEKNRGRGNCRMLGSNPAFGRGGLRTGWRFLGAEKLIFVLL